MALCPDVASLTVNQFCCCNLLWQFNCYNLLWRSVIGYGTGKTLKMKTIAILFVAFCAAVISASAQINSPISTRTINLTAEQYFVIKEYVLKDAAAAPQSESIPTKIGERIPTTITLRAFPSDLSEKISSLKSHVFYVDNGKIVIVDPKDNSIADIIE